MRITNNSDAVALLVRAKLTKGERGQELLPDSLERQLFPALAARAARGVGPLFARPIWAAHARLVRRLLQ